MKRLTSIVILWILLSYCLHVANAESFTVTELAELKKLRENVGTDLYADYMRTNEFLIRWLHDARYDIDSASKKLRKSIEWRKQNHLDGILEEPRLKRMEQEARAKIEGKDKWGRPVITLPLGAWEITKLSNSGELALLKRRMVQVFEMAMREIHKSENPPNSTAQHVFIVDMKGFNLREHVCLSCISFYTESVSQYENNYPDTFKHSVVINAPLAFETIGRIFRPLMSPRTRRIFKIYGFNTDAYRQFLLQNIAPDQLSLDFGGTKKLAN